MAKRKPGTSNLSLRGKLVGDLRELASRFLSIPAEKIGKLDKNNLIEELLKAARDNEKLAKEIRKMEVTIKPSFYLTIINPKSEDRPTPDRAKLRLQQKLNEINAYLENQESLAAYKGFQVDQISQLNGKYIEIQFTWQRIYWFWAPENFSLTHIYELQFGFAILDFNARKGLIACHSVQERDIIASALSHVYRFSLTVLVLTKEVLNNIGSFDYVKRAGYLRTSKETPNIPTNVTYADVNLAAKPVAKQEEENPRSLRKHSFYRIDLGTIKELGIGATSDSGKVYISKEVPLETIRVFGIALLRRISGTLNSMTQNRQYDEVLDTMGISSLAGISDISNVALRGEVIKLVRLIVNMLLDGTTQRPYTVPPVLFTYGVPTWFNYPRLQLTDPVTGDVAYWVDSSKVSQFIRISNKDGRSEIEGFPSKQKLDLSQIEHPITGDPVDVTDFISSLDLIPTPKLEEVLLQAINHISNQFTKLSQVICLPFRINSNVLHLSNDQAFGRTPLTKLGVNILVNEVEQWQKPMSSSIKSKQRQAYLKRIRELGEKCNHMSDDNCRTCIDDNRYLCLRSLVGRYLREPLIQAHKGIELSDIQGRVDVGGEEARMFGFAKLAEGNGGLTARNKNGAILLAQVVGQVDRTVFNTVLIISPSTINEDLRERLQSISDVFRKQLVILDQEGLSKMLAHFEEQAQFDGIDVNKIYRASKSKGQKKKQN